MDENRQGAKLKRIVLCAIAIGIALAAAYATHWTLINLEREQKWARFNESQYAEFARLGFMDYEVITEQDRVTARSRTDGAVHVIEMPGPRWEGVYICAFLVFALIAAGVFVWRAGWDTAQIWREGRWVPLTMKTADFAANPAGVIETAENSSNLKGGIFWVVLSAVMVPLASESFMIVVPITLLGFALAVTARTWTLRVRADAQGLRVASAFGSRRVAWAAIANMKLVDINRERWEKARKGRGSHRSPYGSHWVYRITDCEGREILRLPDGMVPGDRFRALLERIEQRIKANTANTGA